MSDLRVMCLEMDLRLLHEENNQKTHYSPIDRPDAVCPSPRGTGDEEAKSEGRKERRNDETHGPDVKLRTLVI